MELTEGLSFVKPPKRANTFGAKPTLEQLQRKLPQADNFNALTANPNSELSKWGMEIWQSPAAQQSYKNLQAVVSSYNAEAKAADITRIEEKSVEFTKVRDAAFAAQAQKLKDSNKIVRKLRTALDRFCHVVYSFCPVVDVLAQAAPEYVQLSWGVIRFLLQMNINSVELKEAVLQALGDIGERFQILRCFLALYPTPPMAEHVAATYQAFNDFLAEAVKYYKENCIKRFFKNVTHPYAVRFQPFLKTVEEHVTRVNALASVGQGRAIAENTAITKETRNLILMSAWKQDNTNQTMMKELKTFLNEQRKQVEWDYQAREAIKGREEPDPFQIAGKLLTQHNFTEVLKLICKELSAQDDGGSGELSRLASVTTAQGGDSRTYERLGLMENKDIIAWVESRRTSFLWIDGFLSRPDWTTRLSLDVISAAKRAGNVVLYFMCGEHGRDSTLHRPTAWIKRFIGQLFTQRPERFTSEKQCEIITNMIEAKDVQGIWEIFARCIRDIYFGTIYMVIDKIDTAFSDAENIVELQALFDGLNKVSVENRTLKFIATSRGGILKDFRMPSIMVVVPVTPFAKLSVAHRHNNIMDHCRRPKKRAADRLPDRDTDHDLTLSDDSSWDDEAIEEMLETSDEEGQPNARRKERKKTKSQTKKAPKAPASDKDSLDSDSLDSSDSAGEQSIQRPGGKFSKPGKAQIRAKRDMAGSSSEDSLDSLDSLVSLDSLDKALKTSSDEDAPRAKSKKGAEQVCQAEKVEGVAKGSGSGSHEPVGSLVSGKKEDDSLGSSDSDLG